MNLTPEQVRALRTLSRIWSAENFVMIGAAAVGHFLDLSWRETHDLDLVLGVTPDRYPAGLDKEPGWTRDGKQEQTWWAPGGVQIDIIPAGRPKNGPEKLKWPQSGFEMSLLGMRLAFDHAVRFSVARDLAIQIAPLEIVVLLKMVGYLDRPLERDRDLGDIAFILDRYVSGDDDRRYEEDILDLGLEYDEISSFLLGKDLARIGNQAEKAAILEFIGRVKQGSDPSATMARMLEGAPPSWHKDPGDLLLRIEAFERGVRSGP